MAVDVSTQIQSIYDAAFTTDRWNEALDQVIAGTGIAYAAAYDAVEAQEIDYSNQVVDSRMARSPSIVEGYNRFSLEGQGSGMDALGAMRIKTRAKLFSALDDGDVWDLDTSYLARPEIRYMIEKLNVYRRFYVNLTKDPTSFTGLICMYDLDTQAPCAPTDKRAMETLAPHLGKAFEMNRIINQLRTRYNAALAALDMVDTPISIIDPSGNTVLANSRATRLFEERDAIWRDARGHLRTRNPDIQAQLHHVCARAASTAAGQDDSPGVTMALPRQSGRVPLVAIVSPLRDSSIELEKGLEGAFLTIIDGSFSPSLRTDLVAKAYDLTKAEARILPLITAGMTNREIADRVSIGVETVKSQVAAVLAKTKCKNRLTLIWRVFQFSPPIL